MRGFRLFLSVCLALAVSTASAQRIGCVISTNVERSLDYARDDKGGTRANHSGLPEPITFDPQKTYRMPVVLITFSDQDFSMTDPQSYYRRVFNEPGYNEGAGLGCMVDYFRDQSNGRLNFQFDVYGPYQVTQQAGGHGQHYYGTDAMSEAVKQLYDTEQTDFSIYDWDGDGEVNQLFFVAAGYAGNQVTGYVWPNSQFEYLKLPGDIYPYFCSIATELWKDGSLNGFATIAHEICHGLGLPDIYPLSPATIFSAVDEWDLLDGGNYTNRGWCPPNLSAMEKLYLRWDQPEELTQSTTITGMKPVSEGGPTYLIRSPNNDDDYYLLENRQQTGWDYGTPGHGLLITHVDYSKSCWQNNQVNVSDTHFRYDLFHADGKDYLAWDPNNDGDDPNKWTMPDGLRSSYLSTSPYPFEDNHSLTDDDARLITNIYQAADGTISFEFQKGATAIHGIQNDEGHTQWYDLQGRRLPAAPTKPGIYINSGKLVLRQTHQ